MNINEWNTITLRIGGPTTGIASLPADLRALGSTSKDGRVQVIEIGADSADSLESRMALLQEFLSAHKSLLLPLPPGCDGDIFIGWSPRAGQDSLTIGRVILGLLAELNLELIFDMYTDIGEDGDTPE